MKSYIYRNVVALAFGVSLVCLAAEAGTAGGPRRVSRDQEPGPATSPTEPKLEVVSWGTPLEGGPIRVLFLTPGYALLDARDLALRLELDVETFNVDLLRTVEGDEEGEEGTQGEKAAKRLKSLIDKDFDAIAAGNFCFGLLPDEVVETLTEKVRDGTGLFLAHHRADMPENFANFLSNLVPVESVNAITTGIGAEMIPEWQGDLSFVQAGTFEQGRVAEFIYGAPPPLFHAFLPGLEEPERSEPQFLDDYYSLVAKTLRWVAHREPSVRVERVKLVEEALPEAEYIPPGMTQEDLQKERLLAFERPVRSFRVFLNRPAEHEYYLRAQCRKPAWSQHLAWDYREHPIPEGAESHTIILPAIAGEMLLDLWLMRGDDVVDWHTSVLQTPVRPDFEDVTFLKNELMAHDRLGVRITARSSKGTRTERRRLIACVRAVDSFERVAAQQFYELPPAGGVSSVFLDVADLLTDRVRVEAYLFAASSRRKQFTPNDLRYADYRYEYLPVRSPASTREFAMAVRSPGVVEYRARELNRTLAALGTDFLCAPASHEMAGECARANLLPILELLGSWTLPILEESLQKNVAGAPSRVALQSLIRELAADGVSTFILGGPNELGEVLRQADQSPVIQKRALKEVERTYGGISHFRRAWGTSSSLKDETEKGVESWDVSAERRGLKHCTWCFEDNMLRHITGSMCHTGRAGREDLDVGVFAHAALGAGPGLDWARIVPATGLITVPGGSLAAEKARCYRKSKPIVGVVLSPSGEPRTAPEARWMAWHAALNGLDQVWWGQGYGRGAGMAIGPDGEATDPFVETARTMAALKGGWAALFRHGQRATCDIAICDSRSSHLVDLVRPSEAGGHHASQAAAARLLKSLGYPYDFVCPGDIVAGQAKDYALIILPEVRSMSKKEVDALRQFAAQGGVLVADTVPGEYDENGVARSTSPLAALFPSDGADSGRALLSPTPFTAFGETKEEAAPFASLLEEAEVMPVVDFSVKGDDLFHGECMGFRYGEAQILAVLAVPEATGTQKVTVTSADAGEVYDLREGKALGEAKRLKMKLEPGDAALYSMLPYAVERVDVTGPERVFSGNRLTYTVQVHAEDALPGKHLVHVTLRPETEAPAAHLHLYSRTVTCPRGKGESFMPLARNERPGFYVLTARDVLTGQTAECRVEIADSAPQTAEAAPGR